MTPRLTVSSAAFVAALLAGASCAVDPQRPDPLPSWNPSVARTAITAFVSRVTSPGPDFVPPQDRIAVFDNDGTLWAEQPVYIQLMFAVDRIKAMAPQHPSWAATEPYASVLRGDIDGLLAGGEHALLELVMASHAGMTTDEFHAVVRDWIATATHPATGRRYVDMVYQPMLEVLALLRANGFSVYIVSGGGVEFMRPWTEATYGIPPERVIGSSIRTRFEWRNGQPVLLRLPEMHFIDDKAGKPVAIHQVIGRRPILAVGNSDGDLEMLQWTAAAAGPRLALLVHHTDDVREWAYDRESRVGRLDRALSEARSQGWPLIDMKADWKAIYPPER